MATAIEGTMSSQHGSRDALGSVNGAITSLDPSSATNTGGPLPTGPASDQLHKPTFTVTPSNINGGPSGPPHMKANSLQFGDYPAGGARDVGSSPNLAPTGPGNARAMTPQQSPSPVPQPGVSGGRPPAGFNPQTNAPNFGQLGHEGLDANVSLPGIGTVGSCTNVYYSATCVEWHQIPTCLAARMRQTCDVNLPNLLTVI